MTRLNYMKYQVITKDGRAKRARMETVHGVIETPVFMNVGTVGAIKGAVSTDDLREINTQVELSNTYHLHVRTGDRLIKEFGGPAQIHELGQAHPYGFRRLSGIFPDQAAQNQRGRRLL